MDSIRCVAFFYKMERILTCTLSMHLVHACSEFLLESALHLYFYLNEGTFLVISHSLFSLYPWVTFFWLPLDLWFPFKLNKCSLLCFWWMTVSSCWQSHHVSYFYIEDACLSCSAIFLVRFTVSSGFIHFMD